MKKDEEMKFKRLFVWICLGGLITLVLTVIATKYTVDQILLGAPVSPFIPIIPFLVWALICWGIVIYYTIKFWRSK